VACGDMRELFASWVMPLAWRATVVLAGGWWCPRAQAPFAVGTGVACLAGVDEGLCTVLDGRPRAGTENAGTAGALPAPWVA